jgi:hypothetical protein
MLAFFLTFALARADASKAAEQNLLIVTVMSFDRAGNIKHNIQVQTQSGPDSGSFPAHLSQTLPGHPFLCFVCAEHKDSLAVVTIHLRSSCAAGLLADLPGSPAL